MLLDDIHAFLAPLRGRPGIRQAELQELLVRLEAERAGTQAAPVQPADPPANPEAGAHMPECDCDECEGVDQDLDHDEDTYDGPLVWNGQRWTAPSSS